MGRETCVRCAALGTTLLSCSVWAAAPLPRTARSRLFPSTAMGGRTNTPCVGDKRVFGDALSGLPASKEVRVTRDHHSIHVYSCIEALWLWLSKEV
jgi:hypothetical protein